jgi:MFS family permease
MNAYFQLIRQRPQFRYLWLAQVVSLVGDWFNTIASVVLISRYTDSGLAVSGIFVARALPPFLFGPVAGVVADRFNRKTVLVFTDLARMVIVLGFLLVTSADRVWLLYVLTVAQFVISSFFEPARSAILPALVEEDELLVANTLSSATWSAMLTLGAAIGGLTAAAFGVRIALVIDSLTFGLSALFILRIHLAKPIGEEMTEAPASGWTEFIDGLRYVAQRPAIGMITLVKGLGQFGSIDLLAALYAATVFPVGEGGAITIGLMFATHGFGAIIGPIIGNMLGDGSVRYLTNAVVAGFSLTMLGYIFLSISPTLLIAMIPVTLRGMGGSINWTYSSVIIQMQVPDRFLGRVFALDFAIFTLMLSLSLWLTGLAVDGWGLGAREVALTYGVLSLMPVVFWAAFAWRSRARLAEGAAMD